MSDSRSSHRKPIKHDPLVPIGIVVAGIGLGIFVSFSASGPAVPVAENFFVTLASDLPAAYEMTDEDFQSLTSREDLQLFVESNPILQGTTRVSFPTRGVEHVNGKDHYTLTGVVTDESGQSLPIVVYLVDEDDGVEVYGFELLVEEQ